MCPFCKETDLQAFPRPLKRKYPFISVEKRLSCRDCFMPCSERSESIKLQFNFPNPLKAVFHYLFLKLHLFIIFNMLELTSSTFKIDWTLRFGAVSRMSN